MTEGCLNKNNSEYLKVREVAAMLNVTPKHVYNLIDVGKLTAINIGLSDEYPVYRIKRENLEIFQKTEVE